MEMRILIAEDETYSRVLLQRALARFGHEVVAVDDGEAAWSAMRKEWFRVVISDWLMPGMDGLDLCRMVRSDAAAEYVYFILLTSRQRTQENLNEAIEAGVDDFLSKPFEQEEIMTRLRVAERILGYTKRIRQLEEVLPVCSYCKKIRNDQQYWQRMEDFFNQATGVDFSHAICPDCYKTHVVPQMEKIRSELRKGKQGAGEA